MTRGDRLDSRARQRRGAGPSSRSGSVAVASLVLILFLSLGLTGTPSAKAAEPNLEQVRYEGTLSVLNKPVPVYALDSSRVMMEVTGDTVSVTVEFVLVAVLKWDGDTDLCTATMYRLYQGKGRVGNVLSVELKLVDSSNELEGPDCEGVQVPVVQTQTLEGTFPDNNTFKGNIRNAWTVTASKVSTQPPDTETSTTTTSVATESSTTTSTTTTADTIPRRWTDAEFEKRVDEMLTRAPAAYVRASPLDQGFIGVVIAATGEDDCRIYDYSGRRVPGPAKGRWIRLGDTIVTGPNGRVRVELADRDDARNAGPSVINMSINSEMSYDSFETGAGRGSTWISLIRGSIRTFFRGFGRDSGFSVKAGVSVCGIRGSDVLIAYNPENYSVVPPGQEGPVELLGAYVLEGHMDVTNSVTGKTVALTDKQMTLVLDGVVSPAGSFTQEKWDEWVQGGGLEDMQPLSPEERAAAWSQATPTTTSPVTTATSVSPTTVTPSELSGGMLALMIVLAVVVAAAIGVCIILLRRRQRRAGEVASHAGDAAVSFPSFCRHCGSAITSGSTFCEACGKRL